LAEALLKEITLKQTKPVPPENGAGLNKNKLKNYTMDNLFQQKVMHANNLFDDTYISSKLLFLHMFNALPGMTTVSDIQGEKAFCTVKAAFAEWIEQILKSESYLRGGKEKRFDRTLIVMKNNCIIEFDDWYCEILHDGRDEAFVQSIVAMISKFKEPNRRKPLEINLIVQERGNLDLKALEIKRTKLDLNLFYEEDFLQVDATIRQRLKKQQDKGIVLLHGLPGTGKTTYLRYLIGQIKKRVLFVSPSVAGNLMNPNFIQLLLENPNSVLIIEDAENIIMDRRNSHDSAVSNLLNISDGLLSDFLNVQLICTFNSSLTLIDEALMRKGRLIARYEFGKLSCVKAQRLSKHFGFDTVVNRPMSIAEIANQHERSESSQRIEVMGFRRPVELMN
jgi:hypothetical protein